MSQRLKARAVIISREIFDLLQRNVLCRMHDQILSGNESALESEWSRACIGVLDLETKPAQKNPLLTQSLQEYPTYMLFELSSFDTTLHV